MILLSSSRIRSIIADCKTEIDVIAALRYHKIKYTYSTDLGNLSIRIPCRKGYIRIYRTCSKTCPYLVTAVSPTTIYPVPVLYPEY